MGEHRPDLHNLDAVSVLCAECEATWPCDASLGWNDGEPLATGGIVQSKPFVLREGDCIMPLRPR